MILTLKDISKYYIMVYKTLDIPLYNTNTSIQFAFTTSKVFPFCLSREALSFEDFCRKNNITIRDNDLDFPIQNIILLDKLFCYILNKTLFNKLNESFTNKYKYFIITRILPVSKRINIIVYDNNLSTILDFDPIIGIMQGIEDPLYLLGFEECCDYSSYKIIGFHNNLDEIKELINIINDNKLVNNGIDYICDFIRVSLSNDNNSSQLDNLKLEG